MTARPKEYIVRESRKFFLIACVFFVLTLLCMVLRAADWKFLLSSLLILEGCLLFIYLYIKKPQRIVFDPEGMHICSRRQNSILTETYPWKNIRCVYFDWKWEGCRMYYFASPDMQYLVIERRSGRKREKYIELPWVNYPLSKRTFKAAIDEFGGARCAFDSDFSARNYRKHLWHYVLLFGFPTLAVGIILLTCLLFFS